MTARARNGRFTAERTTETTVTERVTERVTLDGAPTVAAIPWAPGWDADLLAERQEYREQRETQQDRCLQFLWNSVVSGEMTAAQTGDWATFAHQLPDLVRSAKTILRAGPGATPLELITGRSI